VKKDQERLVGDDGCCPGSQFRLAKDRISLGWALRVAHVVEKGSSFPSFQ